jgi:glutamine synthetase
MDAIEEILVALERSQIKLQQFHPESAPGQYEFVTGPLPPLDSVDTLLASRDIICAVAEKHLLRATFVPKTSLNTGGTGAHVHISMSPEEKHLSFYAGVLKHLRAIMAFTNCNMLSYEDSMWSDGRYVAWGTQNRETPLRKIEGSHWELKCMDGMANTYLALAAILGIGLRGILDGEQLNLKDCPADPSLLNDDTKQKLGIKELLPTSISQALNSLAADRELTEVLGRSVVEAYQDVKKLESNRLMAMEARDRQVFLIDRY